MLEKAKATVELDGGEMEMYSIACWNVAYHLVMASKDLEAQRWLVLWQKMNAAKREFHNEAGAALSAKYLRNEEKPTLEGSTFRGHIILGGTDMPQF
jgi:hypothetical protein